MPDLNELLPEDKEERDELLLAASVVLFDSFVRHQVFLQRFAGFLRNNADASLLETERTIARLIRDRFPTGITPESLRRLDVLVRDVRDLRIAAWAAIRREIGQELRRLSSSELSFLETAFRSSLPNGTSIARPRSPHAFSLRTPFEGKTLAEWLSGLQRDDLGRVTQSLRISLAASDTPTAAARRVVGTARNRGRDGVTQTTRRRWEGFTRTAVTHFSTQAQNSFLEENSFDGLRELYVAILDSATTPICRSLSGNVYNTGEGPMPPVHYGCRSRRVPFFGEEPPDIPSYGEWLSRQSAMFQDTVLGRTRGRLFRRGGITLDRFVNRQGDETPLSVLADTEAAAFRAAGLDPGRYN